MSPQQTAKEILADLPTSALCNLMLDEDVWAPLPIGDAARALIAEAGRRLLELDCKVNLHGLGA